MLGRAEIERLIDAAGYDTETRLVVAVGQVAAAPLFVSHGLGPDSVVYGGSLAKQITGACAALLARDGALDVGAPIDAWLPELPDWSRTICVRHLVHHTAGLPSTGAVWERMEARGESDWTSDGVIAALSTMPDLDHDPGTTYAYSNVGYACLARIIERISGQSLSRFAPARLFEPLGLPDTTLWSGPQASPPSATLGRPMRSPAPLSVGDGGLWTTARDLLRWNDALLADTLGISHTLHTPGTLDDGTWLDYAWGVRVFLLEGERVQSHGGSWDGATARLVRLPDRSASFAVLALDGDVGRIVALSSAVQRGLGSDGATVFPW